MDTSKLTAARTILQERGQQAREAIAEHAPEVKEKLVETGGRAREAVAAAAERGRESTSDLRHRLAEALAEVEIPRERQRRSGMIGKVFSKFTAGLAIGYVLGARAGRERYEQIKGLFGAAAENPKVQEFTEQARELVTEKTGLGGGETQRPAPQRPQSIREVMTAAPETVDTDATLVDAAKKMRDIDAGAMVVVNKEGTVAGIVTDRDIAVRAVAEGQDPNKMKVGQVLSADLVTLAPTDTVVDAVKLMRDKAVRRLPVVEGGKAVGIVSIGDLAVERDRTSALAHISAAPPSKNQ